MGQQQIILVTLSTIVVGIAIAVGVLLFTSDSVAANRDAMIMDLQTVAANARAFYVKPRTMGGGGNKYTGYIIPSKLRMSENGVYSVTLQGNDLRFKATSIEDPNNYIEATLFTYRDRLSGWQFFGEFAELEAE